MVISQIFNLLVIECSILCTVAATSGEIYQSNTIEVGMPTGHNCFLVRGSLWQREASRTKLQLVSMLLVASRIKNANKPAGIFLQPPVLRSWLQLTKTRPVLPNGVARGWGCMEAKWERTAVVLRSTLIWTKMRLAWKHLLKSWLGWIYPKTKIVSKTAQWY